MDFYTKNITDFLNKSDEITLNTLNFGIIGFNNNGIITVYNKTEENMSGLSYSTVINQPLFTLVAPCLNNYLVALRFETEPVIDEVIPYVFSFKIKPCRVKLRLIKSPESSVNYILVERQNNG